MKAFFFSIPLFLILFFAGGNAFADSFNTTLSFQDTVGKGQKVTSTTSNHASVFEIIANDIEEEVHSGNEVNDNSAQFSVKAIPSGINLQSVTVNSIVALKVAPLFYVARLRIPSKPIYLTNRVFRL